ncbi:MAG: arylsulfatase [Planctomycetes bacterium]|nr:arylsulfatase [Planctomycetota bacterium]
MKTWFTVALVMLAGHVSASEPAKKPNIVLIMTDDQGYGDLACHGNPFIKTPNLDRLHGESVRFTDFHVSPTCSPTRSALMTGRHEFRNGVTHTIMERERLTLKATTLPQVLKTAGYTTGIFGKWHLGDEDAYQPGKRGFDEVFIHGCGGIGQTYPGSCGDAPGNKYFDPVIRHNGVFEKTTGYCTDVFFKQAEKWIDSVKGKPFFCYITPNAPHGPLICPPGSDTPYKDKVPAPVAKFYGMITNIDTNVGQLLAMLKERGLEKDTLVIFMTDNGTATGADVFNAGMRGMKVTPYHGGTRVPSFWRWPGMLKGGVDVDLLTCSWDMLPTLAELAGAKMDGDLLKQVEGRSLVPLLKDPKAEWADRFFYVHVGRWDPKIDPRQTPEKVQFANCSIYWKNYHLVNAGRGEKKWELYDLKSDPGEKSNIAAQNASTIETMEKAYDEWWKGTLPLMVNEGVKGPAINPYHEAYWKQYKGPGPNNVPPK